MMTRLHEKYQTEIVPQLIKRFGYENPMQVPHIEKIVVNMGVGDAASNAKLLDGAVGDLAAITGQKPVMRRARKSISNFKLRAGATVGCSVTLRRDRLYEFLDRFLSFTVPRIRDFRGLSSSSFDGRGNYSIGIKEQIIFPEIDYDKIDKIRGMDITIVTSAATDEEALALLTEFGVPFRT